MINILTNLNDKNKKLCKEYNIDEEIVISFIANTRAFPFLIGKPSSYLIKYMKETKNIIYKDNLNNGENVLSFLNYKLISIESSYDYDKLIFSECDVCNKTILDVIKFEIEENEELVMCPYCATINLLSILLKIEKRNISLYFKELYKEHRFNEIITLILSSNFSYIDPTFKFSEQFISEITEAIKTKNYNIKNVLPDVNEYYNLIKNINLIRQFDNKKVIQDITNHSYSLSHSSNTTPDEIRKIETTSEYFGTAIEPWLVTNKIGISETGFVICVHRESDKAIFCDFVTLHNNDKIHGKYWMPKSRIDVKSLLFHDFLNKLILTNLGVEVYQL